MTDPIADLFTRIRNSSAAGKNKLDVPHSRLKESLSRLLEREGYLREVRSTEVEGRRWLRLYLKMDEDGKAVLRNLQRVSKPGRRVYYSTRIIPAVLRGQGIGIYSTPKGLLTDRECRDQRVGGEYLGRAW
ncbi:MAG: 30S ribosomal protein S8 [Planctomycetaceae bacterium]